MTDAIRRQILAVRDTGRTNMFDTRAVQRIAFEMDFFDLVCFIEEQPKDYVHFIISGDSGNDN